MASLARLPQQFEGPIYPLTGYSSADASSILSGSLLAPLVDGALCHALMDVIELDSGRQQVAEWFCTKWSEALQAHNLVGFDSSDNELYPDPANATATQKLQARNEYRNGPDGAEHEFQYDWFYGQFHGRSSLMERYAGRRFGNYRSGDTA